MEETESLMNSVISVRGFRKAYPETIAVDGLSFDLQPGQVLGLVGPNGAGKTTTLRALAGIIPPTDGTLLVDGHNVVEDPIPAKKQLAYVPDDPKLFDSLTVWEHLEFIASAYEVADFEESAAQLLEQFDLTPKRNTTVQALSRGMRQKLAIGCAYLHNPKAILLDEPLTGLDPRGIRNMKESISKRIETGTAFIVSSHLMVLVEDLCTDLLILNHGKSLYFGPISEARHAFDELEADASLEDVFFHATERFSQDHVEAPGPDGSA